MPQQAELCTKHMQPLQHKRRERGEGVAVVPWGVNLEQEKALAVF